MFVFAMIFYGVVGLFLGAAVLHCLGLLPDSGKGTRTTSTAKTDQNLKPGAVAFLLLSAVSLPVVLAWFGGMFGAGNALFSRRTDHPHQSFYSKPAGGAVWVNGYQRRDGTYVPGHWRSAPDGDPWNNWSSYPNVNPSTGQPGTRHLGPGTTNWGPPNYVPDSLRLGDPLAKNPQELDHDSSSKGHQSVGGRSILMTCFYLHPRPSRSFGARRGQGGQP